jgi:hypothetical protein
VEFLVVYFDEDRGVIVDSTPGAWMTNQTLMLQAGTHTIELAPPLNYSPPSIPIQLIKTTVQQPYEVTFIKIKSPDRPSAIPGGPHTDVSNVNTSNPPDSAEQPSTTPVVPPTHITDLSTSDTPASAEQPSAATVVPPTYVSGVRTDDPRASVEDFLKVSDEVNAFANLISSREIAPPLAIGVFGEWGSGKTFFMERLRDAVDRIENHVAPNNLKMFHSNMVQIQFNAWHYIETNLWASLVEYIFRELDGWLRGKSKDVETLFEQLNTSKQLKLSAARDLIEQRKALKVAIKDLADARAAHDEALKERATSPIEDALTAAASIFQERITADEKRELKEAAKNLGVTDLQASASEFAQLLRDSRNQGVRARLIGNSLLGQLGSLKYLIATTILVLSIPLAVEITRAGMADLFNGYWIANVNAVVVGIASVITSVTIAGGALLRRGNKALDLVDRFRLKFDEATTEATKKTRDEVRAKERNVDDTRQAITEAERRLAVAADRAASTERDYQNDTARGRLNRFIREKVADGGYAKHLGLVATIRQDFSQLAEIMRDEGLKNSLSDNLARSRTLYRQKLKTLIKENPRLLTPEEVKDLMKQVPSEQLRYFSRIILYIDDLDRCPPDKVADVLQAIHLLLFFPLFVVVVAVDARWIARSLETEFPHLLSENGVSSSAESDGATAPPPNPWNEAKAAPAATALDYLEKIFHIPFWVRPMDAEASVQYVIGLTASPSAGQRPEANVGETNVNRGPSQADRVVFEMTPLTSLEIEMLGHFARYAGGSPRRAKRFVNLYQLLKTIFKLDGKKQAEATTVMALLAMSNGAGRDTADFLRVLGASDGQPVTMAQILQKVVPDGATNEIRDNSTMQAILEELQRIAVADGVTERDLLALLRSFGPTILRYSFGGYP